MDEQIKKTQYRHTTDYYPAMRKEEILPILTTWMDPESIILSKSDTERQKTIKCHLYVESKKAKLIEI